MSKKSYKCVYNLFLNGEFDRTYILTFRKLFVVVYEKLDDWPYLRYIPLCKVSEGDLIKMDIMGNNGHMFSVTWANC